MIAGVFHAALVVCLKLLQVLHAERDIAVPTECHCIFLLAFACADISRVCGLALVTFVALPVVASDSTLIAVPGSATKLVATDELSIAFDLTTESSSFSGAKKEADALVERISKELQPDYAGRASVSSEVAVLRQKRISWSSKAKKLSHRVTVTIQGFQGDLPDKAIKILDQLLAVDPRLELTDLEGRLSDEEAASVRSELLTAALQDAQQKAAILATEAGKRVSSPRLINAAPGYSPSDSQLVERVVVYARSFNVSADLVGEIEMSVEIVAEYVALPAS